jgi:hypothetical protein
MKPQLVQNGTERVNPTMHRMKAMKLLGYVDPILVSQITVAVASTIANAESTPSKNKVSPSMMLQSCGASIVSIAEG